MKRRAAGRRASRSAHSFDEVFVIRSLSSLLRGMAQKQIP
jgi:hypothetical protein